MGIIDKISSALFGTKSSSQGGSLSIGGSFSVDGSVAQIGNGVGQVITPDDRETVGIFVDGGLIKLAESNGLAIEPWMAAEAQAMEEKFKGYEKNTKQFCKSVRGISKSSTKIVKDIYETKSEVRRNHVEQHKAHNRDLDTADKTAATMNYEEKRRDREGERINNKLAQWESKMSSYAQAA